MYFHFCNVALYIALYCIALCYVRVIFHMIRSFVHCSSTWHNIKLKFIALYCIVSYSMIIEYILLLLYNTKLDRIYCMKF